MTTAKLLTALGAVDWNENIALFSSEVNVVEKIASCGHRLAIWAHQLESADSGNAALCFVREMQTAGHMVAVTSALACYKSAASSLRTVVETALYYTYFRSHPVELETLVRNEKWYVSKDEVLDFHKTHTAGYMEAQLKLPVSSILAPWYSKMSAIIHGQLPGAWVVQRSIANIEHHNATLQEVADEFINCVRIVENLFFCTVGREFWDYFSPPSKRFLLKGMPGDIKLALKLDAA